MRRDIIQQIEAIIEITIEAIIVNINEIAIEEITTIEMMNAIIETLIVEDTKETMRG
jgi:hypothetical protein